MSSLVRLRRDEKNKQVEIGIKMDLRKGKVLLHEKWQHGKRKRKKETLPPGIEPGSRAKFDPQGLTSSHTDHYTTEDENRCGHLT
jgi:hypothetical protein